MTIYGGGDTIYKGGELNKNKKSSWLVVTSGSVVVPCLASPLGEELFSEGGNADFKYNSMESDDDMLDDMLDDMDLDEMLDDAIESVTAQEEREDDNLTLMKITDTLDLNACEFGGYAGMEGMGYSYSARYVKAARFWA